jgi:hypothetical protein
MAGPRAAPRLVRHGLLHPVEPHLQRTRLEAAPAPVCLHRPQWRHAPFPVQERTYGANPTREISPGRTASDGGGSNAVEKRGE